MSSDESLASEEASLVQRTDDGPILLNDPRSEPVAKFLGICYIFCFVLALSPCIVALLFAAEYSNNESSLVCNNTNSSYLIGLDSWLYTASILAIMVSLTYIALNAYQTFFSSLLIYKKISGFFLSKSHAIFQFLITSFHTTWAIIGIYMYSNQMSKQCQSTDIAAMILVFAILELLNTCCVSCCALCIYTNRERATFQTQTNTPFMFNSPLSDPIAVDGNQQK